MTIAAAWHSGKQAIFLAAFLGGIVAPSKAHALCQTAEANGWVTLRTTSTSVDLKFTGDLGSGPTTAECEHAPGVPISIGPSWTSISCDDDSGIAVSLMVYRGTDDSDVIDAVAEGYGIEPVVMFGGRGPDVLKGTDVGSMIHGGGHRDWLYGGNGPDLLCTGSPDCSNEPIAALRASCLLQQGTARQGAAGRGGDDVVFGAPLKDILHGGPGVDFVIGAGSDDIVFGGYGDDSVHGSPGIDVLYGDDGGFPVDTPHSEWHPAALWPVVVGSGTPGVEARVERQI